MVLPPSVNQNLGNEMAVKYMNRTHAYTKACENTGILRIFGKWEGRGNVVI